MPESRDSPVSAAASAVSLERSCIVSSQQPSPGAEVSDEELQQLTLRADLANGVNQFINVQPDGKFRCSFCQRDFTWQHSLVRHITCVHAGIKKFSCHRCSKEFKGRHGLNYHLRSMKCLKTDSTKNNSSASQSEVDGSSQAKQDESILENSVRVAQNDDSKHRFSSQVAVNNKRKIETPTEDPSETKKHCQDRKYICYKCGKAFAVNKILKRHVKNVHETVPSFGCGICLKSFKTKRHLQRHKESVHAKASPQSDDRSSNKIAEFISEGQHISTTLSLVGPQTRMELSSFGTGPQTGILQKPAMEPIFRFDSIVPASTGELLPPKIQIGDSFNVNPFSTSTVIPCQQESVRRLELPTLSQNVLNILQANPVQSYADDQDRGVIRTGSNGLGWPNLSVNVNLLHSVLSSQQMVHPLSLQSAPWSQVPGQVIVRMPSSSSLW